MAMVGSRLVDLPAKFKRNLLGYRRHQGAPCVTEIRRQQVFAAMVVVVLDNSGKGGASVLFLNILYNCITIICITSFSS